jgi:hypothetical protein
MGVSVKGVVSATPLHFKTDGVLAADVVYFEAKTHPKRNTSF